jgi:hypothetical protein
MPPALSGSPPRKRAPLGLRPFMRGGGVLLSTCDWPLPPPPEQEDCIRIGSPQVTRCEAASYPLSLLTWATVSENRGTQCPKTPTHHQT